MTEVSSRTYQTELARRLAEDVRRVRRESERARAAAESSDGMVRVTVGGNGQIVDLDLDPRIFRDPDSRALADSVLTTIRDAQDGVSREISRISRALTRR